MGEGLAPSALDVFVAFGRVGLFSFGGGSASQLLMRKELVWKSGWFDEDEFSRIWQISKLAPGINQIGQVILYGRRLAGWRGILAAVAGFILPAVTMTILLSIALVAFIGNRYVEDALRIVIPLTGGMTAAIALQMWSPELPKRLAQLPRLLLHGAIVLLCALLIGVARVPAPVVMFGAIGAGVLVRL